MTTKKITKANDQIRQYQNLLTGEIVLAPSKLESKTIDGVEFIRIFNPKRSSFNLMRKDSLKLISAQS